MNEFFRGWKRKLGLLTLAMALVLTGGWVRSSTYYDDVRAFVGKQTVHELHASDNALAWMWTWHGDIGSERTTVIHNRVLMRPNSWVMYERSEGERNVVWVSNPVYVAKEDGREVDYNYDKSFLDARWYWNFGGSRFGFESNETQRYRAVVLKVPYWSIVVPLTLLSAFLLLSKPSNSTQKKITEPMAIQGK